LKFAIFTYYSENVVDIFVKNRTNTLEIGDKVYVLENDEKDRRIWDIRLTDEYEQYHLIRFEIDKSNN
jgi:hypothetical protein